jgi:hypothetical protein
MMSAQHDSGLSLYYMPSLMRSKCQLQALHGNEVDIVVLSNHNPSVRLKSFMLKSKALLITMFTISSDSTVLQHLE